MLLPPPGGGAQHHQHQPRQPLTPGEVLAMLSTAIGGDGTSATMMLSSSTSAARADAERNLQNAADTAAPGFMLSLLEIIEAREGVAEVKDLGFPFFIFFSFSIVVLSRQHPSISGNQKSSKTLSLSPPTFILSLSYSLSLSLYTLLSPCASSPPSSPRTPSETPLARPSPAESGPASHRTSGRPCGSA